MPNPDTGPDHSKAYHGSWYTRTVCPRMSTQYTHVLMYRWTCTDGGPSLNPAGAVKMLFSLSYLESDELSLVRMAETIKRS